VIYGLWHGGASYSPGELAADLETFPSLRAATCALESRRVHGYHVPQAFIRPDGSTDHALTPCADTDSHITVWLADPRGSDDPYPDRVVAYGPRCGIRVQRT